jgi:hypothetical protein
MIPVTLSISIPPVEQTGLSKSLSAPAPAAVTSIAIEISGAGFTTIAKLLVRGTDFTSATDTVTVTIDLPVGTNRLFAVRAFTSFDGTGTPIFQGSTLVANLTGPLKVNVILFEPPFAAPTITSFTPTSGCGGETVTITGINFDPIITNNSVIFQGDTVMNADDKTATITAVSPTSLTVTVPLGTSTGAIRVSNLQGSAVSASAFTISSCSQLSLLFGTKRNLSSNAGASVRPSVAISATTVLVAWNDATSLVNDEIFLARSTDGGATFAAPVNLSSNAGSSLTPSVAISGTTALVAWFDGTPGNNDIFLARSTNGGAAFATPANLSSNAGASVDPSVAISGTTALVSWEDLTPGNFDIFLARSTNGGADFSAPVNPSSNTGVSEYASVAISGTTALVAWEDNTPGNNDIFLARFE